MSKVKSHLINVNLKAGNFKSAVQIALLNNTEGCTTTLKDGTKFQSVYLDNAYEDVCKGMSKHQFAGYLSALEKDGVYRTQGDNFFGMVKVGNAE